MFTSVTKILLTLLVLLVVSMTPVKAASIYNPNLYERVTYNFDGSVAVSFLNPVDNYAQQVYWYGLFTQGYQLPAVGDYQCIPCNDLTGSHFQPYSYGGSYGQPVIPPGGGGNGGFGDHGLTSTPEPGTLVMLLLGSVLMLAYVRRKRFVPAVLTA